MKSKYNFKDPFNAGQLVGMLVMLTFIENNEGIPVEVLQKLKSIAADNVQEYLDRPSEDVHLMINNLVNEIGRL